MDVCFYDKVYIVAGEEELHLSSVTYRRKERISTKYELFLDGTRMDNTPLPTL